MMGKLFVAAEKLVTTSEKDVGGWKPRMDSKSDVEYQNNPI